MQGADDLLILLAVARNRTYSAAAEVLGVNYTTISRRIEALEQRLGGPVLSKGSNGWELTELGRRGTEAAERIELALDLVNDTADGQDALSGRVRIGAPDAFGGMVVAPVLARMHRANPQLSIELATAVRSAAQRPGFDLEVVVGRPSSPRLYSQHLCNCSLRLYASEEYLASRGEPTTVGELAEHPLVFYVESLLQATDLELISKRMPTVAERVSCTSAFSHTSVTRAGGGIGLLPAFLADTFPDLRPVLARSVDVTAQMWLSAKVETLRRPAVRALVSALRDEVSRRREELLGTAR